MTSTFRLGRALLALAVLLFSGLPAAAVDLISPQPKLQFFGTNGKPLSGGKLFTYGAGSTTKTSTFTDNTGSTPNTNPVRLNTRGEPPSGVWLTPGQCYKYVLSPSTDSDPPTHAIWTVDGICGAATGGGGGGLTQLTGDVLAGPGSGSQAATVTGLQNRPVGSAAPTTGQLLGWNGSAWVPVAPPVSGINQLLGPVTAGPGTGAQTTTITPTGVTAGSYTVSDGSSQFCWAVAASGQITGITAGACPSGGGGNLCTGGSNLLEGGSNLMTCGSGGGSGNLLTAGANLLTGGSSLLTN